MINGKGKLRKEIFKEKYFNDATLYLFKDGNWCIAKKIRQDLFKDKIFSQEKIWRVRAACRDDFNKILSYMEDL